MTNKLLPCPFCGRDLEKSEAFSNRSTSYFAHPYVAEGECMASSIRVPISEREDDNQRLASWNRRILSPQTHEPAEWQRLTDGFGWQRVEKSEIEHYRNKGSSLRALYEYPPAPENNLVGDLDDKTIVRLAREHLNEKDYDRLTYEKSPPMFPQATYDVPTYALSQFVKAVRATSAEVSAE